MSKIKNIFIYSRFCHLQFPLTNFSTRCRYIQVNKFNQRKNLFSTNVQNEISETKTSIKTSKKNPTFIVPPLTEERINDISAITGVSIGMCHICWAKFEMSSPILVSDWNAKPLPEDFRTQTNESDILKLAYNLKCTLPESDLYVMETFSMRGRELSARITEIHLSSMLTVLLNGIYRDPDWKEKVIFQKQLVLNNLYGLLIGSERVSTRLVMENIINNLKEPGKEVSENESNDLLSLVQIQPKCLDIYKESFLEKKEDLSIVFLLALSFIDVNIFKTESSLAKLKGRSWR